MASARRVLEDAPVSDSKRSCHASVEIARETDAFDTAPDVAAACIAHLIQVMGNARPATIIEPSAGAGNFVRAIMASPLGSGTVIDAFDLYRGGDLVRRGVDFLSWTPDLATEAPVWVIGNPPFGRRAKLVFDFFSQAAYFADVIAFIVPCVFRQYAQEADSRFTLVAERKLSRESFVIGPEAIPYAANTVWQVWRRRRTGEGRIARHETTNDGEMEQLLTPRVTRMDNKLVDEFVKCARTDSYARAAERFFAAGGIMMARAGAMPGRVRTDPQCVGKVLAEMRMMGGRWYTHNWHLFVVPSEDDRLTLIATLGAAASDGARVQGYLTRGQAWELIAETLKINVTS